MNKSILKKSLNKTILALGLLLFSSLANAQNINPAVCVINGGTITCPSGSLTPTSSTPGGSNTQVQYNNGGIFGGIIGATTNGTTLTLVAPALGTPASGVATNLTGLPLSTGITGFGTGVATALAVNTGTAGAPVLFNGAGGTPTSLVGTNITGTASGLTAGNVTTNANLTGNVTSVGNVTTLATGSASNLNSGTLLAARMPALTGDCTSTVNTVATSCVTTSSVVNCTYNLTTATGTQTVPNSTDCGGTTTFGSFTPSACEAFGVVAGSAIGIYQTFMGFSDSARNNRSFFGGGAGSVNTGSSFMFASDGTNAQAANIQSYNSGTITLAWTKITAPTGTFAFSIRCFK